MKFDVLRSIGHNIADSLASGLGFPIGVYQTDIFGEADGSHEGYIEVDFLTGTSTGAGPSPSLAEAIVHYRDALSKLCEQHRVDLSAFKQVKARYSGAIPSQRFVVTVEDRAGRLAVDNYEGFDGHRPLRLDRLGRVRRDRGKVVQVRQGETQ
ncbi:hypothetical protein [Phenylobacterium montanum]|uniref:Uncharacterized protein n=1 Tax=Phenylobacterium montanum TaxID=2823693 RepID=A0A975IX46_9CAUL|nr:hypothetical protein [Caulobacter sp. S6]QUD90573.1 hypothetical protein KCG34_12230 [Caulobacter sp. S6]